jgi:hypothetical protein
MVRLAIKPKLRRMAVLILLALAYSSALHFLHTITGMHNIDGYIGVGLGLFIGSHPASNMLEMLYIERYTLMRVLPTEKLLWWLAANLFILFLAWAMIFIGALQFPPR